MASPGITKRLRPSKGVHILFSLEHFASEDALLVPKTEDGRVIFAVPWQGRLLVGTTDDEITPETKMVVLREEAEYLLRQLNSYLAQPLKIEEVVSGFAGLRPLVAAGGGDTKELIRDHEVEVDDGSGLISILGGKWTTHRLMAEDTIDAVERRLGADPTVSQTKQHRLAGAETFTPEYWKTLVARAGIADDTAKHLAGKFGTRAAKILEMIEADRSLGDRVAKGFPAVRAEVAYCVRHEMAVGIEDVLARRLGLQLFDWRRAMAAAPSVARILANELGWSNEEESRTLAAYLKQMDGNLAALGLKTFISINY